MKIYYPHYYHTFRCIASACPDSCCKEWAVDVDESAAAFYRQLSGELGDRLRAVLKDEDGSTVMTIADGRCPMWRQDGLCEIQAQLGHDALCKTCREFPRLRHEYGSFTELGLELSCPEAARLILSGDWRMESCETDKESDDFCDTEVLDILLNSRRVALELLRDTTRPLPQVMATLLLYAHDVQGQIDGGESVPLDPEGCLADAHKYAGHGDAESLFDFFKSLEILTPQWESRLDLGVVSRDRSESTRPLMAYFIQRYWLQAVSDYDLISRVKFAVAGCLLVNYLGGDFLQTAQQFSKEIENDPDNVDAILDGAYASPALTDANLLGLLLNT